MVGPAPEGLQPPAGWPAQINWCSFKGLTRSGLKIVKVTVIIVAMFQAAALSPETHVKVYTNICMKLIVQHIPSNAPLCIAGL